LYCAVLSFALCRWYGAVSHTKRLLREGGSAVHDAAKTGSQTVQRVASRWAQKALSAFSTRSAAGSSDQEEEPEVSATVQVRS